MEKLFKVPLVFLFIASCIGLFLRYQLIAPIERVVYSFVLHAHSHLMFLGWVFNVLILAFTKEFAQVKGFKVIFWFLQLCVAGMLVSFPLQGYGALSITFSTLHTFGAIAFIFMFFKSLKNKTTIALMLAKAALLFFVLSSIGPFLLGYLKANGLGHLNLYRNSIYFYLHFQYNGFFLLGVLSLFMKLIEDETSEEDRRRLKVGCYILIGACSPAYILSVLWSQPIMIFNVIGVVSALVQLIALWFFVKPLKNFLTSKRFAHQEKLLFQLSFASLALKSILQLISAHPSVAVFANEFRTIVIAYLHLVLVGGISLFLLAWLIRKAIIELASPWPIALILIGFTASEILLIISPWIGTFLEIPANFIGHLLFFFSGLMVWGVALVVCTIFTLKHRRTATNSSPLSGILM